MDNVVYGAPGNHEGTQLNKLSASTTAVTISVGGNDMEFSSILGHCVHSGPFASGTSDCRDKDFDNSNPTKRAATLRAELGSDITCPKPRKDSKGKWSEGDRCDPTIDLVGGKSAGHGHTVPSLSHLYQRIERAAPNAHLYVLLYPHLFANLTTSDLKKGGVCNVIAGKRAQHVQTGYVVDFRDMTWLNQQVDEVDNKIVQQVAAAGGNISFVDPRPAWNGKIGSRGHGLCGDGNWLNGLQFKGAGPSAQSFHPNAAGQRAFMSSFSARTPPTAPQGLTIAVTGTSASLAWQPPANDGQAVLRGYNLVWDTGAEDAVENLPTSQLAATLTNLSPGLHSVTVSAVNTVGIGPAATGAAVISAPTTPVAALMDPLERALAADAPTAFWPLDDSPGSTTAHDLSGGPAGVAECGATLGLAPGPVSGTTALHLDGGSCSDINVTSDFAALHIAGAVTIEAWVHTDVTQTSNLYRVLSIGGGSQLGIGLYWSGSVVGSQAGNCFESTPLSFFGTGAAAANDEWHQIAFTFDPASGELTPFYDGMAGTGCAAASDSNFDIPEAMIGRGFDGPSQFDAPFDGDLADVAVFNYALSPSQIAAHYAAATGQ